MVLVLWVMKDIKLVGVSPLSKWHLQSNRDKFAGLFHVSTSGSTMIQPTWFFWQDDPVTVSKYLCESVDVTLGADSDDQSETFDQP